MEDLKTFAVQQVRREIKELETELMKDTYQLEKVRNNKAIGYPRSAYQSQKDIESLESRLQYLSVQETELQK